MAPNKGDVIVVNEQDEWLGTMEKMEAHRTGTLHRAFSIFVFNDKGELLIQQRALSKYHSAGLWSNTCCSHPMPAESTQAAAHRRLKEEMGFDCKLEPLFTLRYKADVGGKLIENEYDHIYIGYANDEVNINPDEVNAFQYISLHALEQWIKKEPDIFTPWLHLALPKLVQAMQQQKEHS